MVSSNERYDLGSAKEFGEVLCLMLNRKIISPFRTELFLNEIKLKLTEFQYDPLKDYIVLTGGTIATALFVGCVASMHRTFKVLMFDAGSSSYVERTIQH